MTDEQVKEVYARAEMGYEMLKDRVHDLYDKNVELQQRIDKAIEYIKENASYGIEEKCCMDDLNYDNCDELLEILGEKNE